MSILGTKSEYDEQDKLSFCPAVLNHGKEIPLTRAIFISAFLHVAVTLALVVITAIIMFILQILGLDLNLFQKPEMKTKDIEFVLVNQEAKPRNPNTKYRADKNSRSGGKRDIKKPISMPTAPTKKSAPQKQASSPQKQIEKIIKQKRAQAKQKQIQEKRQEQPQQQHKAQHPSPKPNSAPPRPAPQASMPKPALPNMFSTPIPKSNLPKTLSGGGGGGAKTARPSSSQGGGASGSHAPAPVMSSGSGARGNGRHSSPYSAGGGSLGSPQGGGGTPGIDTLAEPDFDAYMRHVKQRITKYWDPPRGNQTKVTVLLFTVTRDGRVKNIRVRKSSGVAAVDQAARASVEYSAPFRPLPKEYRGSEIEINFSFNYNVIGGNIR